MNLKDLDLTKLSKLTLEYTEEIKCLECCKYFIAPATAACGHTLCHTCWRGRRSCPTCSAPLERKALKLNLPLQSLTNHIQTLGEAFEKLFNIQLDEFTLDTPGEHDKDPNKNVKDWLTSSQNHFSAPIQNSETFSQESQQPVNALEVSASNIMIHADSKKATSPPNTAKIAYVPPPQDDWDKIEPMPDVEDIPKNIDNIVGPMDIEPFFVDESEYTTENPRRSGRKRDIKQDDSYQKVYSSNKNNTRDSSGEIDKKSQKSKQTWNNVKRMRKEFSKLNKKNRNKLNVSIEMAKKMQAQNAKPISNTSIIATQQIVNIDDNTPGNTNKENEMINNNRNDGNKQHNISSDIIKTNNENQSIKLPDDPNSMTVFVRNHSNAENNKGTVNKNVTPSLKSGDLGNSVHVTKTPFIQRSTLRPKNLETAHVSVPKDPEEQIIRGNSDDIEISIKIGNTITNILIKQKNDVHVKINTDREVQTTLEPDNLVQKGIATDKNNHNVDINVESSTTVKTQTHKSVVTQTIKENVDKAMSDKKNTASADTATANQFEITESVEKELSNVMEYETAEDKEDTIKNKNISEVSAQPHVNDNVENIDDLNDLDIFNSGSVKEANVHHLKEHAPSEILISTAYSKLKTQRNTEKRTRENTEEELPENKKAKLATTPKPHEETKEKSILADSEPNYDVIMGQVFASIDADIEDTRKTQETPHVCDTADKNKENQSTNKDVSEVQKTQIIKELSESNSHLTNVNVEQYYNEKHSENVFSILEKDDEHSEINKNDKIPKQVEELLTPVLCRDLDSSQESQDGLHKTMKSNKKSQDYDDSDRSVVEETPQKDLSIPKLKRASTSNLSQMGISEIKKIPSKPSVQSTKSVINLSDTVTETSKNSRDVTVVDTDRKKLTLETPLTITKFADHIIHKSTPVARKSLNFDNENEDDPEQTLCPTSEVIAKTTQEKEFMSKAFEKTPVTPPARPLIARNISKANRKYCLAGSCLTSAEISNVKTLCAQRKWSYVDKYTKDITHLVVGVDEEKKSQRSVKYMCALAASKWIVSFDWINRCLQSKDIVDEEYFEALDSTGEPGPRRSRIAKRKLFEGIKFYCMPPFSVLDANTLKNMLVAAGGQVVKSMKEVQVSEDSSEPALLLAEPENTQEDRFIYLAMEQSIVPVNYEWVLNCLGSYSLGSIQELLLCPSSLLPAATARWPEVLLAQDYD